MKFGFFTDSHFTMNNESRLDNVFESSLKKTREAMKIFSNNHCKFILFGGDLFDRHREFSFELFKGVFNVFNEFKIPIYYIMGNHDERGYRWQTIDKSNAGFIKDIMPNKFFFIEEKVNLYGINIYACHAGEDILEKSNKIIRDEKGSPNILIAHCLLSDDNNIGNININKITNSNIDLVLSGDLHYGYKFQQNSSGVYCYNPGSILRLSSVDNKRIPKIGIFELKDFMGGWMPTFKEIELNCLKAEEIFPEKEEKIEVKKDLLIKGSYIEAFKEFKRNSKDIFEVLEKVGEKNGISKKVLEMIKTYKDLKN